MKACLLSFAYGHVTLSDYLTCLFRSHYEKNSARDAFFGVLIHICIWAVIDLCFVPPHIQTQLLVVRFAIQIPIIIGLVYLCCLYYDNKR